MLFAFILTLLAGLFTLLGGLLVLFKRSLPRGLLASALGFSAGAMLFVSFAEMLPLSQQSLTKGYGEFAPAITFGAFFFGILLVLLIDKFLPKSINPSEREGLENQPCDGLSPKEAKRLMRSGLLVAVAIGLHNFPEGLVTFVGTLQDPKLGLALAVAIAIHNIPEGVAVAAPIYAATKSRKKAFAYTAFSGLAEPAGALAGYVLLGLFLPQVLVGALFAAVAGMMVFISLDELLPAARRYQTSSHQVIYSCVTGMAVMALSLLLLQL